MKERFYITAMGAAGKFLDFESAILVKIIPYDFVDYYYEEEADDDYEENVLQAEKWLMFKDYPGKRDWLMDEEEKCKERGYWEIDLEDFVPRYMQVTNHNTGEMISRSIYQVIMSSPDQDIIEAKQNGNQYSGRTGSQKLLDELGLQLVGEEGCMYYLVSDVVDYDDDGLYRWQAYGIPYDYNLEERFIGDKIILWSSSEGKGRMRVVRVEKREAGYYNYLTRQFFRFED